MERKWFKSMLFNGILEYSFFGPTSNNGVNEDPPSLTDIENSIHRWKNNSEICSSSHGDYLADPYEKIFAVWDWDYKTYDLYVAAYYTHTDDDSWTNTMNYSIKSYLCQICEDSDKYNASDGDIHCKNTYLCDKGTISIVRMTNNANDPNFIYDPLDFTNAISRNSISDVYITYSGTNNQADTNYTSGPFAISESDINDSSHPDNIDGTYDTDHPYDTDGKDRQEISETSSEIYPRNREMDTTDPLYCMNKFSHLWVQCETCDGINFKQFFLSKMNICEHCGEHLKMNSLERIEFSIDPGTWNPMDEEMISLDPIEFDSMELDSEDESSKDRLHEENVSLDPIELDSEEESSKDRLHEENVSLDPIELDSEEEEEQSYIDRLDSYQEKTGLPEAVQTGTGQLNGVPLAIAVMDSEFIAGSMGSVVGEKITRLIEYATNQLLPLIIVCASGGARMQEGSLSLMQMAKISCALYNYQINHKLFYIAILTSPTTGGVTASFGMLGDIIIAEPNATIAFAGKRIIEQLLNEEVPEGSQSADLLFDKGLLDSVVPRPLLKDFLTLLLQLHGFVPLTENRTKNEN
uniref:Acetyl-coenzyme A carboxylase carboxyl transferase subunit beta, chloroplastic n=1 Tax=Lathyrus davidii TaxID=313081 RepID=A0A0F6NEG9_LATDA|nr:acetyl-CoA carboxylase carboxyltransferase beta subunit [Lathyrus davidii]AIK20632.1 acetyl-CoA carboxylase carboxyltransferase beta subunit [Lathyrus davidii]